jgi:spore coat protein CotH
MRLLLVVVLGLMPLASRVDADVVSPDSSYVIVTFSRKGNQVYILFEHYQEAYN